MVIRGQLIDILQRRIFPAEVSIAEGKIQGIREIAEAPAQYILPGFVDAHIHIESAMLTPYEFAKIALTHGTVATISDPHEIANVCGIPGVDYMIDNAAYAPLKFNFGAPSCVPATGEYFETAGAVLDADAVDRLLRRPEIKYLSEVMNFPGVLHGDGQVLAKIASAKKYNKPVDGHAPGLSGEPAVKYAAAGISTDHECVSINEALDKIAAGMYILIREGSAAKNFDALIGLFDTHPDRLMFCSDDKHPDDLLKGHINRLVARALALGYDLFDLLHAACILPVKHYGIDVGCLQTGDPADLIIVDDLKTMHVAATFINGVKVAAHGKVFVDDYTSAGINHFTIDKKTAEDFMLKAPVARGLQQVRVIEAQDGQLITNHIEMKLQVTDGVINADLTQDVLKICVVNRYRDAPVAVGLVKNIGLKKGAIASSVAHDSHNIVVVGVDDESICRAVNIIIEHKGGISYAAPGETDILPLPVAGLMADKDAYYTAGQYERLTRKAQDAGSTLHAPYMTLSFLALPVIPSLKLTDKGLFDVDAFTFADIFAAS